MIITKKALPRRAFLRGVGATLALPLLDAMIPALAKSPIQPARRLGFVFIPMGCDITRWTPAGEKLDELPPDLARRFSELLKKEHADRPAAIRQLFEDVAGD